MGVIKDFLGLFRSEKLERSESRYALDSYLLSLGDKVMAGEFALQLCIDLIANALTSADFETYEGGRAKKNLRWWMLNMRPNRNQTQANFLAQVINEMVRNPDGALVVASSDGKQLIVAKSYTLTKSAFYQNTYSNIELYGGYMLEGERLEEDVLHFVINDGKIKVFLEQLNRTYGELISGTISNYNRGNAIKLGLKIGTMFDQQFGKEVIGQDADGKDITEADHILDEMYENRFKAVLSDKSSITPIEEGLEFGELYSTSGNTKSGAVTTRDIADTIEDVKNHAADAFHIPRGLLKGDVADVEAMRDNFINFAVNPFAEVIEAELNAKLYDMDGYFAGNKVVVQTNAILLSNFKDAAASAEAMLRSGLYNIDEIRAKLGDEPLGKEWSEQYWMTKNYTEIEALKGGEKESGQEIVE